MIAARPAIRRRPSAMSSGRCTKDSATQSTPRSRPNCRSRRSFSVSGEIGHDHARQVDPLVVLEGAAGHHFGIGEVPAELGHPQAQFAIVEQDLGIGLQGLEDLRVRQGRTLAAAERRIKVEAETRAGDQGGHAARQLPDSQLGPLQVQQDPDRMIELSFQIADDVEAGPMVVVSAMAEVQAEDVGAGLDQGANGLGV